VINTYAKVSIFDISVDSRNLNDKYLKRYHSWRHIECRENLYFVLCYQLMKYEVVFNHKRRKQREANLKRKLKNSDII